MEEKGLGKIIERRDIATIGGKGLTPPFQNTQKA